VWQDADVLKAIAKEIGVEVEEDWQTEVDALVKSAA
jgi:hypothetical protein